MSRGNTIFGHKYKSNSRPKIQPKILKSSAVSQSISQSIIAPKKKLDVIIVSVDYNDFLILTLEHNKKIFDNITVVTTHDDMMCQNICRKYNTRCITTDIFYENDYKFNKGAAINKAIESLNNPELILLLDADTIVTSPINLEEIEDDVLYTSDRWICYNYFQYERWQKNEISVVNLPKYEKDNNYGFFQLFSCKNPFGIEWYPSDLENSSHPDLKFSSLFPTKKTIKSDIIHLGDVKKNWDGRTSEKFITDEIFYELYDSNIDLDKNEINVYDTKTEISKYGKFRIQNQISFEHHNGGWSYALKSLNKINGINGIRLECFLDMNFCWINSNQEQIKENWVGILHNPIEAPTWYLNQVRNRQILKSSSFIKSLECCKGLYVFSQHEKNILSEQILKFGHETKINVLRHPTTESDKKWSIEKFYSDKKIIHIGWWLRDIQSFYRLDVNLRKLRIKLNQSIENKINQIFNLKSDSVIEIENLNEKEYDDILCSSVVFINLIDSVVNNTVLECIERNTPIIVNRNPSIEEYIGKDYPLFFDEISDVSELLTYDKLTQANSHLKKINLDRDLGLQIQNSEIYKSIESDLDVTDMLKPGDLEDSEGGIYNPGFCEFRGKNYMIVRVEKNTEKERGIRDLWLRTTSVPHIVELDSKFEIINKFPLRVVGDFIRVEDFRLFTFNNKLYSNHVVVDKSKKIYPVISEVDLHNQTLKILGTIELDISKREVEKNWSFFTHNDELFLIYSVSPWVIFKIDLEQLTGVNIKNYETKFDWIESGFISNSTNPIKLDTNTNIMGFHSRDNKFIYHQGFLIFDDNLNYINSSKEPYLSGGDYDTIHPNVIYTSSISLSSEKRLVVFAGDGDTKTIKIEFKKDKIWKELL